MTYEQKALAQIREAHELGYSHPWPMVIMLVGAVVLALLSIAAAVESGVAER